MYNSNTNERIYVKSNEVQKYLDLGFVLGQNYKANLGKKRMHLPGSDMYGKMIKNEDIQKYLDLGYVFGVNPVVSKNTTKKQSKNGFIIK